MGMSRYHNRAVNMVVLDKSLEVMRLEIYHKLTFNVIRKCTFVLPVKVGWTHVYNYEGW